ncbi:16S rRNA methyltransferase [Legionella norrlandica]|uniref:Ribosomal RNA small subunit methyltransferase E n=1 Tax=Legionella norrlandica TaxID=1498499 RepID=A0A0A2SSA7_9GAMM|nr:16S rRNA (uracil(1498)-N(3))-methyltransferase [Legionella norrlandica]KGP63985.1 16S rRNA methyltransferase [Legionella norrlandica]
MREIRIYQSGEYQTGQFLELSPEAGQHVAVVLRMKPGDQITLFNGDNYEFKATIESVRKKQVLVSIGSAAQISRESPLSVHLAQAVSKGERMEIVMQKSVELGVSRITPVITERCQVKLDKERMAKKMHQWQNIVISACEQCGRNKVPVVYYPEPLEQFLRKTREDLKLILHPASNKTWRNYSIQAANIALIIGPEGGLSDEEIKLTGEYGFLPLSLGPRILRTETAAITALSVLQAVGGDL